MLAHAKPRDAGQREALSVQSNYHGIVTFTCSGVPTKAYFFEKQVKFHLDLHTLLAHLDELRPKRVIVTHMSEDMLARLEEIPCECAEDGKLIEV
jgi:hypothetical protein